MHVVLSAVLSQPVRQNRILTQDSLVMLGGESRRHVFVATVLVLSEQNVAKSRYILRQVSVLLDIPIKLQQYFNNISTLTSANGQTVVKYLHEKVNLFVPS